jgi:hypothetical protein
VVENIKRHLARGGVVLASIATNPYEHLGVALHQTVRDQPWWVATFARLGLDRRAEVERHFRYDWFRGFPDFGPSFPIALTRAGEAPIDANRLRNLTRRNAPYEAARSVYRLRWLAWYALPAWRPSIARRLSHGR